VVQWCHGASAVLILLATLLTRFRVGAGTLGSQDPHHTSFASPSAEQSGCTLPNSTSNAARIALARGGNIVYERGLLRKGVGLCHGVAGSVYALLAVSSALDSYDHGQVLESPGEGAHWLMRAVWLAQLATDYERLTSQGEMRVPDRPYSLHEGIAGMCCAWGEVLRRLEGRKGPGGRPASGFPGYDDLAV